MRAGYPALEDGYAYLDQGRPGAQGADKVIKAIAEAYRVGIGNAGGCFPRQPSAHRGCVVGHCQPGPARSRRVPRRRQSMPEAATLAWTRQGRLASAARGSVVRAGPVHHHHHSDGKPSARGNRGTC